MLQAFPKTPQWLISTKTRLSILEIEPQSLCHLHQHSLLRHPLQVPCTMRCLGSLWIRHQTIVLEYRRKFRLMRQIPKTHQTCRKLLFSTINLHPASTFIPQRWSVVRSWMIPNLSSICSLHRSKRTGACLLFNKNRRRKIDHHWCGKRLLQRRRISPKTMITWSYLPSIKMR